jgi:ABC-2 type transport system ATP-binding protein
MATIVSAGSGRIENLLQKLPFPDFHRIRTHSSNDSVASHPQSHRLFRRYLVRHAPTVYDPPKPPEHRILQPENRIDLMSMLETSGLTMSYGSRRGIQDVSLQIESGEIFGFLGPNGAGKSTTIRILMGLLRASAGHAHIFGLDCWKKGSVIRRDTGYVAGDVRLYPWLTLNRGLKILSQLHGRSLQSEGRQLAARFRLEPDLQVRQMSRGNRQKVALVLALAIRPRLLILDEPTSGLDPLMQDTLMVCLRELAAEGRTILFSSHTLSEVESLCDRIAMIRAGRIVEYDSLISLKAKAPRRIQIQLSPGQMAPADWPASVRVLWQPQHTTGQQATQQDLLSLPPGQLSQTCLLELRGSSGEFLSWAAGQRFADVSIGAPSLDILFRSCYAGDDEPRSGAVT